MTNEPENTRKDEKKPVDTIAVSIADAAQMIGISRRNLYTLIATRKLRTVKIGRRRVVPVSALREMLGEVTA